MSPRPRLVLVDDHQLLLESLRLALQSDYDIVATATEGLAVLPLCREVRPDAILLDLSLRDRSGLEIIADLRSELPAIRIVVITMHADRIMADASLESGAHGFVPKDAGIPELISAVNAVLQGNRFVSDRIPKHPTSRSTEPDLAMGLAQLTPRQRRIVRMIGEGRRTADIAADIGVSVPTVTFHRSLIRKALGLDSEWSLLKYAILVRMSEQETS